MPVLPSRTRFPGPRSDGSNLSEIFEKRLKKLGYRNLANFRRSDSVDSRNADFPIIPMTSPPTPRGEWKLPETIPIQNRGQRSQLDIV
jgi:hypothetical protein